MTPEQSIAYIQGITGYKLRDIEILDENACIWLADVTPEQPDEHYMIIVQQDHYIRLDGRALYWWCNRPSI